MTSPIRALGEGKQGKRAHLSRVTPSKQPRPPWLYDGPLTDRVRLISCPRCRRPVLEALADGLIALRIDLTYLTPLEELEHLVAGGHTLMLWPDPPLTGTRRLGFRGQFHIRARPGRGLPEHDCAVVRQPDPSLLASRSATSQPQEPPF